MRSLPACAVTCILLWVGLTAAGQQGGPSADTARVEVLRAWLEAVERHQPGVLDRFVGEVGTWDRGKLRLVGIDIGTIVSLIRVPGATIFFVPLEPQPDTPPSRRPPALGPPSVPRPMQVRYSGAELEGLRQVAKEIAGVADFAGDIDSQRQADRRINRILKRGATLHADIAILAPPDAQVRRPPRAAEPGRVRLDMSDGQQVGLHEASIHWEIGRQLLERVRPKESRQTIGEPGDDSFVRLWYLVTGVYMQSVEQLDSWHGERAVQLFPRDAETLFFSACLHDAFSSSRVQSAMELADVPRHVVGIESEDSELRYAERLYRRVLEQDERFVEARIRLGRVLGRRGRHQEAAQHLRQAIPATQDRLLQYYAHLFLGAETEALGQLRDAQLAYERAGELYPFAQSPRFALSALTTRTGNRSIAVRAGQTIVSGRVVDVGDDPWWSYYTSQTRAVESLLAQLRRQTRDLEE